MVKPPPSSQQKEKYIPGKRGIAEGSTQKARKEKRRV